MDVIGLLISPVVEIMKCSCPLIVQQIGYVKNLKRNFEMLNEEARNLSNRKEDIERELNRHGTSKMPTTECLSWLNKVDEILKQVNEIEQEFARRDQRCLRRWCIDILSSRKLGRHIVKTMKRVLDISGKSNFEEGVVVDALPQIVETMPAVAIEDGTSTQHTLQKILECVRNGRIQKIGIWGMGGVGKTTAIKILNNQPEIAEMFQFVIWVTVGKEFSIRKLQNEIAQRLSLKLSDDESDERFARRLFQSLRTMKFLLLMDDLWDKVELDDVGIPCPNQENGCKIVLTTRYQDVCHRMETDEEIMVEPLSKEEAWKLFCEKVGEVVDSPCIKPLARHIVDECGGLPLALVVVGASLRKEDNIHIWENALQELNSPETSDISDMELQVFKQLQFSFDRLKDDNIKNCFLYAALYPEDFEINTFELIEYWRAEGLINTRLSLGDIQNQGHAVLKHLIDASLLLQSDRSIYLVKMHDVIRDLALRITSPMGSGHRFLVRANKKMEELPENEELEHVSRLSLMQNEIGNLPEELNCPTLLTLLLQMNSRLRTVPESFFERMHTLRVLDLSETSIKSLPPSMCNLVNLRGLYLKHCFNLKTLPPQLGELKKLEVLDARRTMIKSLPVEIGRLAHLIVLQVAFSMWRDENEEDVVVSRGIISKLSKLEQLSITIGSMWILSVGQCWDKWFACAEEVEEDVSCLQRLMSLEFFFPQVEHFKHFIERSHPWKEGRFMAFNFIVGSYVFQYSSFTGIAHEPEPLGWNRVLTFCGCASIPNAIVEVLGHANSFKLIGYREIRSLNEFGLQIMSQLRRCLITECDEIEIFMEGHQLVEAPLPCLEQLAIHFMPNMRSIWEGSFPPGSLNCLRILCLSNCCKLNNIFSRGIIHQLSNLEELTVDSCSALEEVISEDAIAVEPEFILTKLKVLWVSFLPGLVRILKDHLLDWTSLEVIRVSRCHKLKKLPGGINNAPKLRRIMCEREWWDKLEWDDNAVKLQLEPLVTQAES